jgi:hypothetical protein
MGQEVSKTCFVASPIGAPDSSVRKAADALLAAVIRPTLEMLGYTVVRADEDRTPGLITLKIMRWVLEADVMVADLTGTNANVMYELAVRHAARKPVIQLATSPKDLPFDIAQLDTIFYDHDMSSVAPTMQAITAAVKAIESGRVSNSPVSVAVDYSVLASSPFSGSQVIAEGLDDLRRAVAEMRSDMLSSPKASRYPAPGEHAMNILGDETLLSERLRDEGWSSLVLGVQDDDSVELSGIYGGRVFRSVVSEPNWWIRSDKGVRELGSRMVEHLCQQGIVASMRSDLKNLVVSQEEYFAEYGSYAPAVGRNKGPGVALFSTSGKNVLALSNVSPQGWTAVVRNPVLTAGVNTCGVFIGPASNAPNPAAEYEGAPACWAHETLHQLYRRA